MEFLVQTQTYNQYGASAIFSRVGDLLMVRLGDYGGAVKSVWITAYLQSPTRIQMPALEGHSFDQFHNYLKTLPKITFRRKLKRAEIQFVSTHFDVTKDVGWDPSVEKSGVVAIEIAEILPLLKKRIKPEDDFEIERFLEDARQVLTRTPASLEEWESIREQAKRTREAIYEAKSLWERLEIDWSLFHPNARAVLDDPFFWKSCDDMAPHGNDTGDDLLADYRRWEDRNGTRSPIDFLERQLISWNIKPIDWSVIEEDAVRKLNHDDPITLRVCDESAIALVFAVLKMRAECPVEVIQMALAALTRRAIVVKESSLTDEARASWETAFEKMKSKLASLSLDDIAAPGA